MGNDTFRISVGEYTGDLFGQGGNDEFVISVAYTGSLDGGAGDDTFVISAPLMGTMAGETGSITGGTGTDTLDVTGLEGPATPVTVFIDSMDDTGNGGRVAIRNEVTVADTQESLDMIGEEDITRIADIAGIDKLNGGPSTATGGSFLVVLPEDHAMSDDPAAFNKDLVINPVEGSTTEGTQITLPDLTEFAGAVLIGGTAAPPMLLGGPDAPEAPEAERVLPPLAVVMRTVEANTLTLEGPVGTRGSLVLMGSNIMLAADVAAGVDGTPDEEGTLLEAGRVPPSRAALESGEGSEEEVILLAVGSVRQDALPAAEIDGPGDIVVILPDGSVESERTIYAGSGVIIAEGGVENSTDLVLFFDGGDLQFAVSGLRFSSSSPSLLSRALGADLSPRIQTFIGMDGLGLSAVSFLITFFNPATNLTTVRPVTAIDVGLFEEELSLFSTIGQGIALYLSQCEEEEGCIPSITEEEVQQLIELLQTRIAQLRQLLMGRVSESARQRIFELIAGYKEELENFQKYLRDVKSFYGEGIDQEFEDEFSPESESNEEASSQDEPVEGRRQEQGTIEAMLSPMGVAPGTG